MHNINCKLFLVVFTLFFLYKNLVFSQNNKVNDQTGSNTTIQTKIVDSTIITSNFGDSRETHFHTGIDIACDNLELYAIEDVKVVFFNKNRKDDIRYGNGDLIILENNKKTLRYNYSHIDGNSINKKIKEYKKGEPVAKSGNSGYSTGPHLHLEVEDIVNNKYLNPIDLFPINDTTKPVIEDIFFVNNKNEKYSLRKGDKVVRGGKLFIKCFDKIDGYDFQLVPYEFVVYINGEEITNFNFSKMDKINNDLYINDTDKNFQNLYLLNEKFTFFMSEKYFLPDIYSIKVIIKDYSGNQSVFLTNFKVFFEKM